MKHFFVDAADGPWRRRSSRRPSVRNIFETFLWLAMPPPGRAAVAPPKRNSVKQTNKQTNKQTKKLGNASRLLAPLAATPSPPANQCRETVRRKDRVDELVNRVNTRVRLDRTAIVGNGFVSLLGFTEFLESVHRLPALPFGRLKVGRARPGPGSVSFLARPPFGIWPGSDPVLTRF